MRGTFLAALAAVVSLIGAPGQSTVTIDESRIRATLENGSTHIAVPIESTARDEIHAELMLDWVGPDDRELGSFRQDILIPPGGTSVDLPFAIPKPTLWLRLRYSLTPQREDARAFARQTGMVALTQIARYVFELKVAQVGVVQPGKPFTIHARSIHPATREPIGGLTWNARLAIGKVQLSPARISPQSGGFCDFVFDVPPITGQDQDRAKFWAEGRRGDFSSEVSAEFSLPSSVSARIQTDKPIYQPGQTLHLRGVVTDSQGKAFEGATVVLQIDDQDSDRIHTAHLVASRFGVVHDDWAVPVTAGLGDYQISLTTESDEDTPIASHAVRIGRYELPEFNVTAKPDRSAYLPDQKAKVSITGTYLFGKPVPLGHVHVTDADEQQYPQSGKSKTSTPALAEGVSGENGTFVAELDLRADHDELRHRPYLRFKDVHFAAYYTDPGSGRTEQRRFDVRITREPIHVYSILGRAGGERAPLYVSTDYADGSPASTSVDIRYHNKVTVIHTNRYGVGKAFLANDTDNDRDLTIRATDSSGQSGTWVERDWQPGSEPYRMDTARTIHRIGESGELRISAPPDDPADQVVMVTAIAGEQSVAGRIARFVNGQAQVTFPYQSEFRRTVIFAAWNAGVHSVRGIDTLASIAVIFPDASDLKLVASTERLVYKPGEKATVRMQVTSADGRPLEAALGLAIVDQAVHERARTDSEFGQRPWFACAFCTNDGEAEMGGVRLNDLYQLKPATAVSSDLDLVAEALVARARAFVQTESGESIQKAPGFSSISSQVAKIGASIERHYAATLEFPSNISDLSRILGREWTELRDPWGIPYRATFSIQREDEVVQVISSGPDKRAETEDDFVVGTFRNPYFAPVKLLISQILKKQKQYPASEVEFETLLSANGLLLDSLRDPWGTPYRAKVQTLGMYRYIWISSAGPDRKFETPDDFMAASFEGSYFERERARITHALQTAPRSPQTLEEFQAVLDYAGIDITQYRDAWGHPYHLTASSSSRYTDRTNSETVQVFGALPTSRTEVTPVTQRLLVFAFHSFGPDGLENTGDDFDVARFTTVLTEESSTVQPKVHPRAAALLGGTGTISGVVTDASGAVIPDALVVLIDTPDVSYEALSGADGTYQFTSVPAGDYTLHASCLGFQAFVVTRVPATADHTTTVDFKLKLSILAQQVLVEGRSVSVNYEASAQVVAVASATPRVREYFPETLLWLPEVLTDASGAAHAIVPIADSVTTWKVAAIASTMDGRIAEAESDFRSFQPFFLDFNPPKVLTEGDQIDLPVTVRNYQDREQKVSVKVQPNDWSSVTGPATKQLTVPSASSANVSYTVLAKAATDAGRERIISAGAHSRDAVEKPIRVHPDGQEITQTAGDLVAGPTAFSIAIPSGAVAGATRGELRLYPNVTSMLVESAKGILDSPHGCAEQTISAGYASLITLRYARTAGIHDPQVEKTALSNISEARDGLVAFESPDGGISYWPHGPSDVGVTAYALSFLLEASSVVSYSNEELSPLVTWLEQSQGTNGLWVPRNFGSTIVDRQSVTLTALVARALAAAQKRGVRVHRNALASAYHYIAAFTDEVDDPYALAQFILAALDSGDETLIGDAAKRLSALARGEKGALYWDPRTNTPFYGWGTTGRLETTALAISGLSAWRSSHLQATELDSVVRRGLIFLLRGRDQSGGWSSTQATVLAMRAMAEASAVLGSLSGGGGQMEVRMNGRLLKTLRLPDNSQAIDPIVVDLSGSMTPGDDLLELKPSDGTRVALALVTSTHWLPWTQTQPRQSGELRLAVSCDHLAARTGEPVRCSVKAKRVGFQGYGMMIAEIGLPPGAEVDRASLESVLEDGSAGVDRYGVLPDRVLFYLWPKSEGASFEFVVRPRFPMAAKSPASVLYDYYNPEARSEVPPLRWLVK